MVGHVRADLLLILGSFQMQIRTFVRKWGELGPLLYGLGLLGSGHRRTTI